MVVHAGVEGLELIQAMAALALVDVVDDVAGEAVDHAGVVARIEGVVVTADQGRCGAAGLCAVGSGGVGHRSVSWAFLADEWLP